VTRCDEEIDPVIPPDLRYTTEHEWLRAQDGDGVDQGGEQIVTIGVTDYAQEQLGDIVYVSLPEPGDTIAPGTSVGELESTKSVSDLYAPLAGVVVSRNEALESTPELINSDPYGEGWLITVRVDGALDDSALLTPDAYGEHIA
jgi:glycine cleavage system H protein